MLKRVILFGVLFFSFSVVFSKVKYEDSEYYKMLNLGAVAEEDRVEIQEQLEELKSRTAQLAAKTASLKAAAERAES